MSGTTPRHQLPYPTVGDPVYKGAEQIEALARAVDAKLSGSGGGGGTGSVTATPGTLALRDDTGRTQVTDPSDPADAANRGWIEAQDYAPRAYVDQAIQDAEIGGGDGGGEGSLTPESVTATAGSLALRDASGRTQVSTPSVNADAANKGYVDTTVTSKGYITASALTGYATTRYVDDAVAGVSVPDDVVRASDLLALRTQMFGGPNRTTAPFVEIRRATDGDVAGNIDWVMTSAWQAVVDTDGGYVRGSDSHYRIPVAGRYQIEYQLLHAADNARAGGAMKVLRNGTDVLRHTIASQTATPSLEGPTMRLSTDYLFNAGDTVRIGYWYSAQVRLLALGFGSAPSKVSLRWVGPV
ncbi:hypothetical protein [Corynebacterium kalidii]